MARVLRAEQSRRDHLRRRQVVGIGQRLVLEPEDVEAGLVPGHEILVLVHPPPTIGLLRAEGGLAVVPVGGVVETDELVRVFALERVGLQREVFPSR